MTHFQTSLPTLFMDIISLFPSPPHLLRLSLRLASSLLVSTIYTHHRRMNEEHSKPLADFDVDPQTGFFPRQPLPHLPESFERWERALSEANRCLSLEDDERPEALNKRHLGELWRSNITLWPILDTDILQGDIRLLQRAHYVLAWLVHLFVHSISKSDDASSVRVPRSLAFPLVQVSRCLGIAPVLTFADTVLWNCEPDDAAEPISIDNMRVVNTFSETDDERAFYTVSARAELRGVEMLRIIEDYNNLPNVTDMPSISKVSRDLHRLATIVDDISEIIQSVRPICDPHVFYWDVRPWWKGSDADGPSGAGWIYEGVEDSKRLDLSGPSAGQSSVMHALDIFLDIDHKLSQKRSPSPSVSNQKVNHGFMDTMRRYMPGKHREFLSHLAATPRPIRELAKMTPALRDPYDAAVLALKKLRDLHMRIACLYVVSMSRSVAPRGGCPISVMVGKMEAEKAAGRAPVRGTGGNDLSALLKAGRDATRRAALRPI